MKKTISVFIAITLLICTLNTAAAAQGDVSDLCFAVASDLHYNIPSESLEWLHDTPVFWYANRRAAMEEESSFIIDEFLRQCANDASCEYVLISGDLADHGRTIIEEHYAVAEKLRAFEESTGKEVFVINGNHDMGASTATDVAGFKEIYAQFGYDKALVKDEATCSYTADLGTKYRLIALDSCDYNASTQDGLTTERLKWVKEQAQRAEDDGRHPILMMHHNLLDHMPLQTILSSDFIVKNHLTVAELFADWGIKLVFTGHEHCSDATSFTSAQGNVIYDFATTSLTMYPLAYRVFSLTDDEISYKAVTVEHIDTDALTAAVSGYTDEHTSLMNNGLNAYALQFLKAGIRYRLERSLSAEKLGVSESDIYYDLVMTAVNGLTDILEMPLYGENSAQELAKEYGLEIPDSGYENGWDLVTSLVAMHYAGEEAYTLDSTEVTVLLRTAALILRTDLPAISDELLLGAADAIMAHLGTLPYAQELKNLGIISSAPVTPAEYFLLAIASPLIYSFAYDDDGINDNNGVLPGYGTVSFTGNLNNIFLNTENILSTLIKYMNLVLGYLAKLGINIPAQQ